MNDMCVNPILAKRHHEPLVSVIMANYCGADYVERALQSVLAQTLSDLEVIVVDDASTDNSVEILRAIAATDQRVKIFEASVNAGPGASRNLALENAKGDWVAVVDADDVLHPERLERLINWADELGTDVVADDLVFFPQTHSATNTTLLEALDISQPIEITAERFLESDVDHSEHPSLGYLKPVFRRSMIADLRYPYLKIGEDYEFLLSFLLDKGFMHIVPEALYFYRRHSNSISHRLSETAVTDMIAYQQLMLETRTNLSEKMRQLMEQRISSLQTKLTFEKLIAAIKSKDLKETSRLLLSKPSLIAPLSQSLFASLNRRRKAGKKRACESEDNFTLFAKSPNGPVLKDRQSTSANSFGH